jgi:hypothetical protein
MVRALTDVDPIAIQSVIAVQLNLNVLRLSQAQPELKDVAQLDLKKSMNMALAT